MEKFGNLEIWKCKKCKKCKKCGNGRMWKGFGNNLLPCYGANIHSNSVCLHIAA